MANISDTIRQNLRILLRHSDAALRIVWINIALFIILRLAGAVCLLSGHDDIMPSILHWSVEVPSSPALFLTRPWTLLTYMFAQYDVWHIIFNLLCFYWFAVVLLNIARDRRLWSLYLWGGVAGAIFYIIGCSLFPAFADSNRWLIGGSAAVLSVITYTAMLCPDTTMNLFLIGEIRLKWVALIVIALSFASGFSSDNLAGNLAHAGGVAAGLTRGIAGRFGISISHIIPRLTRPSQAPKRTVSGPRASADDIRRLDTILDKIKKSGYASLTGEERRILFDVSNRIK